MARWSFNTQLAPDRWAALVGLHPCHWNGVTGLIDARSCADQWFQYPWQADPARAGRETVGQAVEQAENKLTQRLRFYVTPRYITDEVHVAPCSDILGLKWGYLQEVGVEARDEIQVDATITYSDTTGDGLEDTGMITVTVPAGIDPCEVAVYYPSRIDPSTIADEDETWRIRPLNVSIVGTTAAITGSKCQFVTWLVHSTVEQDDVQPDITDGPPSPFMETVDVFRRYTDPTGGAVAIWDNECDGVCVETTQSICAQPIDERVSTVRWAYASYSDGEWTATAPTRCRRPDRIRINYRAGWEAVGFRDCDRWGDLDTIITKLSLTLLRENICQCQQFSWLYQEATEEFELTTTTMASAYSMFGTMKRGALDAYEFYVNNAITRAGVLVGPRRQRGRRAIAW